MAEFDGKFFRGSAGGIVYKTYRGKQIIIAHPQFTPSSLTQATLDSAVDFGVASNLAKDLRLNFYPILEKMYDGPMINRLNKETRTILTQAKNLETGQFVFTEDSFQRLDGFEFNMNSPVRDYFFAQSQVTQDGQTLSIIIPEMSIPQELKFPKDATLCSLHVAVGMYDLTYGHSILLPVQSTEIPYSYHPKTIEAKQFDFQIEPGCLCLVLFYFQYSRGTFSGKMFLNNVQFSPAAILKAVMADGEVNKEATKKWETIDFKTSE